MRSGPSLTLCAIDICPHDKIAPNLGKAVDGTAFLYETGLALAQLSTIDADNITATLQAEAIDVVGATRLAGQ